jgi:tetratricopeptide (TPR) repeat protein
VTGDGLPVGRETETTELGAFLDELKVAAAACLLEGEAGIGKTTLWRYAVDAAAGRGYCVLTSRPVEAESQLSYSGIGDLLEESALPVLGDLPAPQARALEAALLLRDPGDASPTARAVAVAVLGILRLLAAAAPVLVAVDDIQWLDRSSAGALSFVGRRLQPERIGLLLAARTPLAAAGLGVTFDRSPVGDGLHRVRLGPLSPGALRVIVHSHVGVAPTRPLLSRLHEISRGNPFYAIELARALPHDVAVVPEFGIPPSLHEVVLARLARLPANELEVLKVAAALSQPTVDLLGRALGREPRVPEAIAAGIIEAQADPIRFTHPLLASAVSSRATVAERRALHLLLASIVGDEEQTAQHLAQAAAGPDAAAAAVLERAAAAVRARGTAEAAAELAEQAAQMTPPGDRADLHRRRLAAATYHFDAGASEKASALLTDVLSAAAPGHERAEALLELGIVKSDLDRLDDAAHLIEEALGECGDDALTATAHLNLAWIYAELSGADRAVPHAWAAVRGAERLQDPALLAQALGSAVYAGLSGRRPDSATADALTRGVALERDLSVNLPLERRPSYVEAIHLTEQGKFDAARGRLERLVQLGRDTADAAVIGPLAALTALNVATGRLDAALADALEAADIAEQVGRETPRAGCLSLLARVEAIVGRIGDARGHGELALALADRSGRAGAEGIRNGGRGHARPDRRACRRWPGRRSGVAGRAAASDGRSRVTAGSARDLRALRRRHPRRPWRS